MSYCRLQSLASAAVTEARSDPCEVLSRTCVIRLPEHNLL